MSGKANDKSSHPIQSIVGSKTILICAILVAIAVLFTLLALQRSSSTKQPKTTYSTPSVSPSLAPSFVPTPTLAPGQKAIYAFYIQATSHKSSNEELTLSSSNAGKIFTADIGTLIILYFGTGNFHITHSSAQDIFEAAGSKSTPIHLPSNAIGAFNIVRSGYGTITVVETE